VWHAKQGRRAERLVVFCLAVLGEVWFVDFLLPVVERTAVVTDEEMKCLLVFVVFVCVVVELLDAECIDAPVVFGLENKL
tara:strand:- start:58 stop:297 length:240 start_codon:yes stop_codon:yes gene_type:complete